MTPITGTISLGNVRTELGASGTISLNDTNVRRLAGKSSGAISLADNRACEWIGSTAENVVLHTYGGSPGTATSYRFVVAPSVTVGATSTGYWAMQFGSFPSGSTITLDNYGYILGAGGPGGGPGGGGSGGGHALNASFSNQTMVVNNMSGGAIYGGGGGGGGGGTGGTGGTGGQGVYYTTNTQYNGNASNTYVWVVDTCSNTTKAYWGGSLVYSVSGTTTTNSGTGYYRGTLKQTTWVYSGKYFCGYEYRYEIYIYSPNYTSGGAGGAGGAGGYGGRGQGYDGAAASGSAGSGGSAGSAGGTNAGSGGYGGTGGTGGTGGSYGNSGAGGATGGTGYTGNAGNYTGGSAGGAGYSGASGGLSGYYFWKSGASATFNNYGSVAGYSG